MKRLFFLSITMLTVSFAFANNEEAEPKEDVQLILTNQVANEQPQKTTADCEIVLSDGTKISCNGCDCAVLATAAIIADRTIKR